MKLLLYKFYFSFIIIVLAGGCSVSSDISSGQKLIKEGDIYFSKGEIDKAIGLWTEGLKYKQRAELYEKIVMAYIMKNQIPDAEKWVLEGLTYFPDNVNLFFDLALISFHNNDFKKARMAIDMVLRKNEYYRNAHLLKGMMYEKENNLSAAKREYINEVNINPGSTEAWKKLRELRDE
ncbi:MAG: hypothetical protein N3D17_01165 [bacterium]|nr:hypothetical protein [bacterium]